MRRLFLLIIILTLSASSFALAEETQLIETSLFTIELPVGLNPDLDEFTREDFPFLNHIVRPITIQGQNEDYMLMISLYDFSSKERHRIDSQSDRSKGLFDLICEYNGLTSDGSIHPSRRVRPEGDFRDFILGSVAEKGYVFATYYNQNRGEGYVFELRVTDNTLMPETAEALLLSAASSIREAGVVYPEATGKTLVVTHVGINVRSAPDANSSILVVAKQGETFPYLGENGIWYMIDVDGKIGYVSKALTQVQE